MQRPTCDDIANLIVAEINRLGDKIINSEEEDINLDSFSTSAHDLFKFCVRYNTDEVYFATGRAASVNNVYYGVIELRKKAKSIADFIFKIHEKKESNGRKLISNDLKKILPTHRNHERALEDLKLFNNISSGNIIFIGMGINPHVMRTCVRHFPVNAVGIDINEEAIIEAEKYFESDPEINIFMGKFSFWLGRAEDYDYSDATSIYIPGCIINKSGTLIRIEKTGKLFPEVVISDPVGILQLFYEPIGVIPDMREIDSFIAKTDFFEMVKFHLKVV